jgi:hypothetical protein
MFRKVAFALPLLPLCAGLSAVAATPTPEPALEQALPRPTLGTLGLTDRFSSVFALNSNGTWVGLPNGLGAPSFIGYRLSPSVYYTAGTWRYNPATRSVSLYGPDGTYLCTLNGLNPWAPVTQRGTIGGWRLGPTPTWGYIPA